VYDRASVTVALLYLVDLAIVVYDAEFEK